MPGPVVLGLDSATKTGWGLVHGDQLVEKGIVDASLLPNVDTLAAWVCAKQRPNLVVIEDNYFAKNIDTLKALSRIVGAWQLAFAVRGVKTKLVVPSHWQSQILGRLVEPGAKSPEVKAACIRWVEMTYHVKVSSDAADAIAIATCGAREFLFAERLKRGATGVVPRHTVITR